jgi:predicted small lipoprotein YifL
MHNLLKTPTIGLVLLTLMMLTACGQKRDLYLPDEPENNKQSEAAVPVTKAAVQVKD